MHCSNCGNDLGSVNHWPVICTACRKVHYKNPIPVVVCFVPAAVEGGELGVLLVHRSSGTMANKWALPGGFIEISDPTWQDAASREVREETGFIINPEQWLPFDLGTARDGNILIFVRSNEAIVYTGDKQPINRETDGLDVTFAEKELAFPQHTEKLARFVKQFILPRNAKIPLASESQNLP